MALSTQQLGTFKALVVDYQSKLAPAAAGVAARDAAFVRLDQVRGYFNAALLAGAVPDALHEELAAAQIATVVLAAAASTVDNARRNALQEIDDFLQSLS
jgi:hypothetical protein